MIDWEKQEKEYREKRIQRLKDKKPYERYKLMCTGDAFLIHDSIAHRNHEQKCDYLIESEWMYGKEYKPDPRYKNKNEFMELLNHLDRTVNGNLYEQYEEDLLSKDIVYDKLLSQIDIILNNIDDKNNDKFEVTYHKFNPYDGFADAITIQGNVYRDFLHEMGFNHGSFEDNKIYLKIMQTINNELDKYEHEKNNTMIDYLTELRMKILRDLHANI